MIDLRKFNTAHKRASKAEGNMHTQCGIMAIMLQEFFDEEITVLWQDSDGFVVLHDVKSNNNLNTHVDEVISAIKNDINAFR